MLEQLQQIDTGVIDDLIAIQRERATLAQRMARMEAEKSRVSDVVFQRVRSDYAHKSSELARLAAPLEERGRVEYAKLRAVLEELETAHSATRLDQEEMAFRRDLGEYDPAEFDRRVIEIEAKLATQAEQIAQVGAVRQRFLEAFDFEAARTKPEAAPAPPSAPPATPETTVAAPTPAAEAPRLRAVLDEDRDVVPVMPPAVLAEVEMPPSPESDLATPEPVPPVAPSPPVAADAAQEGTVLLGTGAAPAAPELPPTVPAMPHAMAATAAKLLAVDDDLGVPEFPLRALTFIGRTPDNQIRLNKPAISRRHAQLSLSDGGWVLKDLHSESGSYVNGERIQERTLADGDRVQIGTVRFTFSAG